MLMTCASTAEQRAAMNSRALAEVLLGALAVVRQRTAEHMHEARSPWLEVSLMQQDARRHHPAGPSRSVVCGSAARVLPAIADDVEIEVGIGEYPLVTMNVDCW